MAPVDVKLGYEMEEEDMLLEMIIRLVRNLSASCKFFTHTRVGNDENTVSEFVFLSDSPASETVKEKVFEPKCQAVFSMAADLVTVCVRYAKLYPDSEDVKAFRSNARKLKKNVCQLLYHVCNPDSDKLRQQNDIIAVGLQLTNNGMAMKKIVLSRLAQRREASERSLKALPTASLIGRAASNTSTDSMAHLVKQILTRVHQFTFSLERLPDLLQKYYHVLDDRMRPPDASWAATRRERIRVRLEDERQLVEEVELADGWNELEEVMENRRAIAIARQKVLTACDGLQRDLAEITERLRGYAAQQWPNAEGETRAELLSFSSLVAEMRNSASQLLNLMRLGLLDMETGLVDIEAKAEGDVLGAAATASIPMLSTSRSRISVQFHLNDRDGRMQLLRMQTTQLAEQQKQMTEQLEQVQQHRQLSVMQFQQLGKQEADQLNKQMIIHRQAAVKRDRLLAILQSKESLLAKMGKAIDRTGKILHSNNLRLLKQKQQLTRKKDILRQQLELGNRNKMRVTSMAVNSMTVSSINSFAGGGGTPLDRLKGSSRPMSLRAPCAPKLLDETDDSDDISLTASNGSDDSDIDGSSSVIAKSKAQLKQIAQDEAAIEERQKLLDQQMIDHEARKAKYKELQVQVQGLASTFENQESAKQNNIQVSARKEKQDSVDIKLRQYALLHTMRKLRYAEGTLVNKIALLNDQLVEHKNFLHEVLEKQTEAEKQRRLESIKKQMMEDDEEKDVTMKEESKRMRVEREEKESSERFRDQVFSLNKRLATCMKLLLSNMVDQLKAEASGIANQQDLNIWQEQQITSGDSKTAIFADSDDERVIRAGTLNQLVIQLTDATKHDLSFVKTFLTTFPSFTTPEILFRKLVERFDVPQAQFGDIPVDQWKQNVVLPIQLRVFNVLKIWLDMRFSDFDFSLMKELNAFLDEYMRRKGHAKMANNLAALIKRKVSQLHAETLIEGMSSKRVTTPAIPSEKMALLERLNGVQEEMLARHLTHIDFAIYRKIEPGELLNQAWMKGKLKYRARHVLALIDRFNMVSQWTSYSICAPEKLRSRVTVMVRFIKLAQLLYEKMHNFNTLMAIISGINSSAVHRMKWTKEDLPRKAKETLESLSTLMNSKKSFQAYRETLHKVSPPNLPYLGIYLTDLVFMDDGNADFISGLINFRKREMIYKVIEEVQQYQQTPYDIAPDVHLLSLTLNLPTVSTDELWGISLMREPKGKDKSDLVQ